MIRMLSGILIQRLVVASISRYSKIGRRTIRVKLPVTEKVKRIRMS